MAVKVAVHRLRQNFKKHLRAEIARTVDLEDEVDSEKSVPVAVIRAVKGMDKHKCPGCGARISAGADGLCAACLLEGTLQTGAPSVESR